jgi:hypothetical protein
VGVGPRPQLLALWLVVPALHAGCFASTALDVAKSQPTGTLDVVSSSLGNFELVPTACGSGERQMFLGADFLDASRGLTARLILDPAGTASVRLFPTAKPLDAGLLFRRPDCARFDLSLERTGWQINDVYDLRVALDLDCRASDGNSVRGELAVEHCH